MISMSICGDSVILIVKLVASRCPGSIPVASRAAELT